MKVPGKVLFILVIAVICFFCIYLPLVLIWPDLDKVKSSILALGTSLFIGIVLFFIAKDAKGKFLTRLFITALIIGSLGFLLGFIGPIIFWPEANQGPLLGIFITGPLSFLAGLVGGGIYWRVRVKNKID